MGSAQPASSSLGAWLPAQQPSAPGRSEMITSIDIDAHYTFLYISATDGKMTLKKNRATITTDNIPTCLCAYLSLLLPP